MKKLSILSCIALSTWLTCTAVTFKVKVPEGTQKCYVVGAFNNWNEQEAPEMQKEQENLFTLTLSNVSSVADGYKYLSGRDWLYVEKDANGDEIDNRTAIGNPDEVKSWRTMPEYGIETVELTVNNYKRLIKIYTPVGYDESTAQYPVIYYNTVQQRYNNAGDDNDSGDYFFGPASWNAHNRMEKGRPDNHNGYIMVQICSFLAENTPDENPDFAGTGHASTYLTAFISELMDYIGANYRVAGGAENTTIVGADYGAVFALYAAMTRPDIFGTCVAMSPMLWINTGALDHMMSAENTGQTYYISAGELEPQWMTQAVESLAQSIDDAGAKAHLTIFRGAAHNDDSWGENFADILKVLPSAEAPSTGNNDDGKTTFNELVYTMHSASNKDYILSNLKGTFVYTEEYRKKGTDTPVKALVFSQEIDKKYTADYYWQIGIGEDGTEGWLNGMQTIGFNTSRKQPAWQNTAIFEDGTIYNVAAIYNGFTVQAGTNKTTMTPADEFTSTATVSFPSGTKEFTIHYGSVNSGSDQGALTPSIKVSDNCTQATITYNFHLNQVTVDENNGGNVDPEPVKPEFPSRIYTLYTGESQTNLQPAGTFVYTTDYRRKGSDVPVEAMVLTIDVDAKYKSQYYWNVACGQSSDGTPNWLQASPKSIGFSNSHSVVSWFNVAVYADETIDNIAAHSEGFKVVNGNNKYAMTKQSAYISQVTVPFGTTDKTYAVNFGSVNSASDQGPVTPTLAVAPDCLEAIVTYDFNLNKVTVQETKHGEVAQLPKITSFTAVPAVAAAGQTITFTVAANSVDVPQIKCTHSTKGNRSVSTTKNPDNSYAFTIDNASEGIYTVTATLADNSSAQEINVRVLPGVSTEKTTTMTVNAYENVDWSTTGRYKGNFHTHTSQSFDTQYSTSVVVDRYRDAGYEILALTDHDASSYPWTMFDLYNPEAEPRYPEQMGMLAIPGNELSKDRRNNWSESTGGEFNHHNDFFTGRKGQEFMSLRESYAYTNAIGGMQIINHPGQYWNLSTNYKEGEKNSARWHADNFCLYPSLIGLEVYNQGNRRPNDRILWDQILTLTMPGRPVWGYSCDDTHTTEQYFRNYQFMLMPELTVDALKEAMQAGATVFSYEYTGSGQAKAPHINSIEVNHETHTITIDTPDSDKIEWIYSTHQTGSSLSTTQSTVVGIGNKFDYTGFNGTYVRARLVNQYGETATQPFGFETAETTSAGAIAADELSRHGIEVVNDRSMKRITVTATEDISRITVINAAGAIVNYVENTAGGNTLSFSSHQLASGVHILVVATPYAAYTHKLIP